MGVAKQLYQLQELDLEIESNEQALSQKVSQLGENQAVIRTKTKLTEEQQRLDELKHQQRAVEGDVADLTGLAVWPAGLGPRPGARPPL